MSKQFPVTLGSLPGKLEPRQAPIPENYFYLHQGKATGGWLWCGWEPAVGGRQAWVGSQEAFLEEEPKLLW